MKESKNAYFIMGPESAGNRMMTQAFNSAYDFGDGGHEGKNYKSYVLRNHWVKDGDIIASLANSPNRIVLVRSVPRKGWPNKEWPPITSYCLAMIKNGYNVHAIVMDRNTSCLIKSQVGRGHVPNEERAEEYIFKARRYIRSQLKKVNVWAHNIQYEQFVSGEEYRRYLFEDVFNLDSAPRMEFYNANDKYK